MYTLSFTFNICHDNSNEFQLRYWKQQDFFCHRSYMHVQGSQISSSATPNQEIKLQRSHADPDLCVLPLSLHQTSLQSLLNCTLWNLLFINLIVYLCMNKKNIMQNEKKNVDGILVLNIITLVLVLVPIIADNNTLLKFWSITSLTCVLICANTQIKTHQTYCWTRRSWCQHWWKYSFFLISWICTVFVVGM